MNHSLFKYRSRTCEFALHSTSVFDSFSPLCDVNIFSRRISRSCCVCGKFVNCYKLSTRNLSLTHTRACRRMFSHYLRSSCQVVAKYSRKKNKETVSLILAPVTARNAPREILRSCTREKNSTCGSYFARYSWVRRRRRCSLCKHLFSCHVRVLGKYYDRTTWNYHPRSDIKATSSSCGDCSGEVK